MGLGNREGMELKNRELGMKGEVGGQERDGWGKKGGMGSRMWDRSRHN